MAIRTFFASILISAFAVSASAQNGTWTAKASSPDVSNGHSVAVSSGYLYQYGGFPSASSWRYDPSADAWTARAGMPVTCYYSQGAAYGRFCFAFGTSGAPGAIYAYNTTTNAWFTLASTLTVARTVSAVAAIGSKIYICGGFSAAGHSDVVDELDATTGVVTARAVLPVPCRGGVATALGSRLFVMAGSSASTMYLNSCFEYDPAVDQWTTRAPLPQSRIWIATFAVNSRIFAVGGYTPTGHSNLVTEYHPVVDEWTARTSLPSSRSYAAGCVVGGKPYVTGGATGFSNLAECLEFTPPAYGTPPADPTALWQQTPGGPHLAEGAWTNGTAMEFGATLTDADAGDTLRIEVEVGSHSGTGPTSVTISGMTEGPYTWRCRARDLIGNVNPAGWVSFGTAAVDFNLDHTAPPVTTGLYPIKVDLWAPTAAGATVDFGWSPVTDNSPSVTYELEISLNSAFSPLVTSATNLAGTTTQFTLPINVGHGAYFWRIRAIDQAGNPGTSWSQVNAFHLWFEDGIDHGAGDGIFNCAAGSGISSPLLLLSLVLMLTFTFRR